MGKNYDSFKEIDLEIRRLKLQSQIAKEELKMSLHNVKHSFAPSKVFGGVFTGIVSSGLLLKILTPIATFAIGKFTEKKERKEKQRKKWWPFG